MTRRTVSVTLSVALLMGVAGNLPGQEFDWSPGGMGQAIWAEGDYLLLWAKGMSVPPLVTTGTQAGRGVLGADGTQILYPEGRLHDDNASGVRILLGALLDGSDVWGVEGEYLALSQDTAFAASSDGDPLLARPFLNAVSGVEDAELVARLGQIAGEVSVFSTSRLQSAGIRLRRNLLGTNNGTCSRLDFLCGYRFLRLDDDLAVMEDLTSLNPLAPSQFEILDRFNSHNAFHGGELGLQMKCQRSLFSFEGVAKIALGNSHQDVRIDGSTLITTYGVPTFYENGILTQRTNIGRYEENKFAVVPELGVKATCLLTQHLEFSLGYRFIYWSRVARAGDQIDRSVNPDLFAPENVPFTGPLSPSFNFHHSDYWVQGLQFGLVVFW